MKNHPEPAVYLPEKQSETSGLTMLVRTARDPNEFIPSLLAIVKSLDRRLPVASVHTLDTQIEAGLSSEQILGYLSSLFGALSTLLAGIGLYGVLSHSVTRRTREIGVRYAVGARTRDVAALFLSESLRLLGLGLVGGTPVALVAMRTVQSMLFGVTGTDVVTLLSSSCVLSISALLATAQPLWKAARMNPLAALRYE